MSLLSLNNLNLFFHKRKNKLFFSSFTITLRVQKQSVGPRRCGAPDSHLFKALFLLLAAKPIHTHTHTHREENYREMADKPSRALVLYGDGLARFVSPAQTHLNSLASRALCGFLALPHSPPSGDDLLLTLSLSLSL